MIMIHKDKNQYLSEKKLIWVKQEWNFWISSLESRETRVATGENEGISLHLYCNSALSLAKAYVEKKSPYATTHEAAPIP